MDNYIYIGGAVRHATKTSDNPPVYSNKNFFMPVLIKLDHTFKYVWGYRMDYNDCDTTSCPEAYAE